MLDSGANIERQIQFYQRKYELNPHSRAFAPLADLYRKAGRLEEAIEVLEAGLAEHPRYVSALVILARCHVDAGGRPSRARHSPASWRSIRTIWSPSRTSPKWP